VSGVEDALAQYRAMVDASLDCVITMDVDGEIIEFNPAAERTFGRTREEALGADMADLILPPHLREAHREGLERYLNTEEPRILDQRVELTAMRSDGSEFPVELTVTRIDLPGPPIFTGFVRDITDRKRAEDELRDSRRRIVESADAARRKLERDLHDGAQQQLVALGMAMRLSRAQFDSNREAATELLDEAIAELTRTTKGLRELARGIHPAVLTEGGIKPAVESLVSRAAGSVHLLEATERRFPAEVEATAYFLVAEALTNVSRYAEARRTENSIRCDAAGLVIEVKDDGRGGADPQAGSGLRGLADRLAAVDGELRVLSPAGKGTELWARIPSE